MAVELGLYGLAAGLLYSRLRTGVVWAVIMANILGRLGYGLLGYYALPLVGLTRVPLWFPLTGAVVAGLPGTRNGASSVGRLPTPSMPAIWSRSWFCRLISP